MDMIETINFHKKSGEDLFFLTCHYEIKGKNYCKYIRSQLKSKTEIIEIVTDLLSTPNIKFQEMEIRSEDFLDEIVDEKYLELSKKELERLTKLVEMKETKRTYLIGGREQDLHSDIMNCLKEVA